MDTTVNTTGTGTSTSAITSDYSDSLVNIQNELVKINDHIEHAKAFVLLENEYLFVLVGVALGAFIGFVLLKGLLKNA